MQIGYTYQFNKQPVRQAVLLKVIEGGRRVLAQSCTNLRKIKIPAREIHDFAYHDGWSLVSKRFQAK